MKQVAYGELFRAMAVACCAATWACEVTDTNDYTEGAVPVVPMPSGPVDAGSMEAGACVAEDAGPPVNEGVPCDFARVDPSCAEGPVADSCLATPVEGDDVGAISGTVVLNDGVMAGGDNDANGVLYIAVLPSFSLTDCPGPDSPLPVSRAVVHCADFRSGEETIAFTAYGVPLREEPWQVLPLLDVNPVACTDSPVPDTCDIVGLPAEVVVNASGEVTLDSPLALVTDAAVLERQCGFAACE